MKKRMKKMLIGLVTVVAILAVTIFAYLQLPVFGANPTGERLAKIQQSPNYQNGKFVNIEETITLTADDGFFPVFYRSIVDKSPDIEPQNPIPSIKTDLSSLPKDKNWFVWLGHSSYLLNVNGKSFLIDPVLISATPMPFGGKPFKGADIYQPNDMPNVDFLVITHDHYDHLDYDTIKQIKPKIGKVITGLGNGSHFERWGFNPEQLIELDWYENHQLNDELNITALPTRHSSGRSLKSNQTLWASFMLSHYDKNIYIGGDRGYGKHFADIHKRFANIDLAILENGQYDKDWANIHLLPEKLVQTVKELEPKKFVAVHNSKFVLAKHAWYEPMAKISENAEKENLPLFTPKIGEVFYFDEDNQKFDKWWE